MLPNAGHQCLMTLDARRRHVRPLCWPRLAWVTFALMVGGPVEVRALSCATLHFNGTAVAPYTMHDAETGRSPLSFAPHCSQTQRCLFVADDSMQNIRFASTGVLPTYQNLASSNNPSIEDVYACP